MIKIKILKTLTSKTVKSDLKINDCYTSIFTSYLNKLEPIEKTAFLNILNHRIESQTLKTLSLMAKDREKCLPPILIQSDFLIDKLIELALRPEIRSFPSKINTDREKEEICTKDVLLLLAYFSSCEEEFSMKESSEFGENSIQFSVEKNDFREGLKMLKGLRFVVLSKDFMIEVEKNFAVLENSLKFYIAAPFLLSVIRKSLTDIEFYNTSYQSVCTTIFFKILKKIISNYPCQCNSVFNLMQTLFKMELPKTFNAFQGISMNKNIFKIFICLIQADFYLKVFEYVKENAKKIDFSIIRFFLIELLKNKTPFTFKYLLNFLGFALEPICVESVLMSTESLKIYNDFMVHLLQNKKEYSGIGKKMWMRVVLAEEKTKTA